MNKLSKIRVSLLCLSFLLLVTCKVPNPKDEVSTLNQILDSLVTEQYLFLKSIEENNYFEGIDSIYHQGNLIIAQYEKGLNYERSFSEYCQELEKEEFINKKIPKIKNIKSRVRLLQINYLNIYLCAFVKSYFQVDLLSFVPIQKEIRKNLEEVIEIVPSYQNRSNNPVVLIDRDTLKFTPNSYIYKCKFDKPGEYFIEPEAIIIRWVIR